MILISVLLLMTGCTKGNEGTEGKIPDPEPSATPQVSEEPEVYVPSDEVRQHYINTWIDPEYDEQSDIEILIRLILGEDGGAQMPVQNGIGEMLGLYAGTWSLIGDQVMHLELIPQGMEDAEGITGDFTVSFMDQNTFTLTCAEQDLEFIFFEESSFLDPSGEYSEQLVIQTVRNYIEETTGEAYPGVVEVDSWENGMIVVHVYEDMEDHTATYGWYSVDPVSLIGNDEVTGEQIDFSGYCGAEG